MHRGFWLLCFIRDNPIPHIAYIEAVHNSLQIHHFGVWFFVGMNRRRNVLDHFMETRVFWIGVSLFVLLLVGLAVWYNGWRESNTLFVDVAPSGEVLVWNHRGELVPGYRSLQAVKESGRLYEVCWVGKIKSTYARTSP